MDFHSTSPRHFVENDHSNHNIKGTTFTYCQAPMLLLVTLLMIVIVNQAPMLWIEWVLTRTATERSRTSISRRNDRSGGHLYRINDSGSCRSKVPLPRVVLMLDSPSIWATQPAPRTNYTAFAVSLVQLCLYADSSLIARSFVHYCSLMANFRISNTLFFMESVSIPESVL